MNKLVLSLALLTSFPVAAFSQSGAKLEMSHFFDSIFSVGAQKSFPGLSYAYVGNDTSFVGSYGTIEWGSQEMVTPNTRFQLGSIGKVLTAISVLQLAEEYKLDLDEDISSYIAFDLDRYKDSKITLRALLTHSGGMNDRNIGYFAKDSSLLKSLEQHLIDNLPSFYQPAGLEINYSNYSYALAGFIVEEVSGYAFHEYVAQNILIPLNMQSSFMGFDFNYHEKKEYAKGHVKAADGFEVNKEYARHATPAGSFISTARDMQKLLKGMLDRDTILLGSASWEMLFTRQFSNDSQIGGYSLGLEEQISNGKTYWSKEGMLLGYLSQIVFWSDSTAMFIAVNTNNDEFLEQFHLNLNQRLIFDERNLEPAYLETELSRYVGEFRNARYDREGVENIISLFRGAFNVWANDSSLLAWHNGKVHEYKFIGNHTFQNSSDPDQKMVFVERDGRITKLFRNVNIGGLDVPSTFEKTKWFNSPTFINEYYGIIPLIVILYSISLLFVFFVWLIRIWSPRFWKWKLLPRYYYLVAFLGISSLVVHIFKAVMPLVKSPIDFLFGLPVEFLQYNNIAYFIIVISFAMLIMSWVSFKHKKGSVISRINFCIVAICISIHICFLSIWSFI